jgi:hypothetical protein
MRYFIAFFFLFFSFILKAQTDTVYDARQNRVFALLDKVVAENKLTESLDPEQLNSLPIGIVKEIGATRYIIAIDSAYFTPTGAYFNAYMAIDFPNSDKRIAFAAKNIKFNPTGVIGGEQSKLVLVSRHSFKITPELKLNLNPDGGNYVEWNCNGFQSVNLKGEFEFSGDRMIPIFNNVPDPSKTVKATFEIHTDDIHNFIVSANITPFTLQGLDEWSFHVTNAVADMSEISNFPAMQFPQGYVSDVGNSPMWTGFYLQQLEVVLPNELSKNNQRTAILAQNILIDGTGFSGKILAQNVFSTQEGSMNGWGFSVDEISVSFLSNQLSSGSMKGKIQLPAMDTSGIKYNAMVSYDPVHKDTKYSFTMSPAQNVSFSAFSAKVDLFATSQISIQKQNGKFIPRAILNGEISLQHENASTPKITFQSLTFETHAPYLTNGVFGFVSNSEQSKTGGFNVSINNFRILQSSTDPKIGFDAAINFMNPGENSFSAGTSVMFGANVGENNGHQQWTFKNVAISAIHLEVNTQVFYLSGQISFYENDPVFGKGFDGLIRFRLPQVMDDNFEVNAQFGCTDFKYFYVDAFVPVGFSLGSVKITRLNGGMYYHMRPVNSEAIQFYSNINQTPAANAHKTKYVPDNSVSTGFKAGVSFESLTSQKTMNGDAMFEIAFSSAGGLDFLRFEGKVFCMATVPERANAPAQGFVLIQYDHINRIFDATLQVYLQTPGLYGQAVSKIHIDPQIWYICIGRPSVPASLTLNGFGTASAYVLVGNQLEPMAAPPAIVASLVSSNGLNNLRDESSLANGSGFVGGVRFTNAFTSERDGSDPDAERFHIYAYFSYGVGFDMMLVNYGTNAHCSGSNDEVGFNGWLASGQLFCYLQGGIGIEGRVFKKDFNVEILSGTVAAILGGKVARPTYLYGALACQYSILGLINGSFTFDFQLGNDCTIVNG